MKKLVCLILAMSMVLTSFVGCGSSGASSAPTESTASDVSSSAEAPKEEKTVYGLPMSETFVFGAAQDAKTMEPMYSNQRFGTSVVAYHIHDVLAWREVDGTVVPRMAESWKMVDDTTWEFKLRDNVFAHDGEKLTSEDVKFSMERAMSSIDFAQYQLPAQTGLKEVVIIDELTFQLKTKEPTNTMEFWLFEAPILPHKYYSEKSSDEAAKAPIGFGPYKFVEWVTNDHITLTRNDNYWGEKPSIKNIVFRVIPEESARLNELRAGSIDFAERISIDIADQADSDVSHKVVQEGLRKITMTMSIEKGNPALKDKRVRQAINYAIDKESICNDILSGYTSPYNSYVNPANNNPALSPYPYDPEKAKALLAEAGYANGLELTIVAPSARYGLDKEITMQIAEYLKEVGITAKLEYMELGVFLDKLDSKELTDLVWIGWAALVNPVVENLILTTGHVDNSATYSNAEFDKLYAQLASEMDSAKRQEINFKMQEIVWNDCPWLWLWKLPQIDGLSNRVNWNVRADGYFDLFNASFK